MLFFAILLGFFIIIYYIRKQIYVHRSFRNFLVYLLTAYIEFFKDIFLFFKIEFIPFVLHFFFNKKNYDYTLWYRWRARVTFLFTKFGIFFFFIWLVIMLSNIYKNNSVPEFLLLVKKVFYNLFNFFFFFNVQKIINFYLFLYYRIFFFLPTFFFPAYLISYNLYFYKYMNVFLF